MSDYIAPTSSSIMVHRLDAMKAKASPDNAGALTLEVERNYHETFAITIFTESPQLSIELAAVINDVLAKHDKLRGQIIKKDAA